MNLCKRGLTLCFVGGGSFALLAEGIFCLIRMAGVPQDMQTVAMLAIVALLGAVSAVFGLYERLNIAGFGAILPFCGMTAVIVKDTSDSLMRKESSLRAYWCGVRGMTEALAPGFLLAILLAIAVYYF